MTLETVVEDIREEARARAEEIREEGEAEAESLVAAARDLWRGISEDDEAALATAADRLSDS